MSGKDVLDPELLPPESTPLVRATAQVDKNDMLAISIVRAEDWIHDQLKAARADRSAATRDLTRIKAEIQKACKKHIEDHFKKRDTALKKAFTDLRFNGFSTSLSLPEVNDLINAISNLDKGKSWNRRVEARLTFKLAGGRNYYGGEDPGVTEYVTLPPVVSTNLRAALKIIKTEDDAKKRVADLFNRLHKVPMIERRARAAMAESALKKTNEGREVLEALTADIIEKVKALPSHTD